MKITSEQIKKINDKCSNGWQLDVRHAIICSEKQLVLQAQKSETEIVRGTLWWNEVHENFCTVGKVPQLHLALYHTKPGSDMMTSYGLGKTITLGDMVSRTSMKVLQDLTKNFTEDDLLRLADKNNAQLNKETIF